jgi:hypothetical protein
LGDTLAHKTRHRNPLKPRRGIPDAEKGWPGRRLPASQTYCAMIIRGLPNHLGRRQRRAAQAQDGDRSNFRNSQTMKLRPGRLQTCRYQLSSRGSRDVREHDVLHPTESGGSRCGGGGPSHGPFFVCEISAATGLPGLINRVKERHEHRSLPCHAIDRDSFIPAGRPGPVRPLAVRSRKARAAARKALETDLPKGSNALDPRLRDACLVASDLACCC